MASNISVAITVDTKQYIAGIKQADTATTAFAQKTQLGLGGLGTAFTNAGNKVSGFATKLAGLGFAAATISAIRFGDSIKDINDATGISIENILGFSNAVALNGGSAEGAQKAILKFVGAIDEAASEGKEMQKTFAGVGVSLQDLENLSEQDLLAKTIQGLSKITSASERVAASQKLLGKEFRAVNLQGVADGLESATSAAAKYADTINKTADLQNKLDVAFQKLQLAILKTIEPLSDFVSKLTDEQIDKMVQAVIALGTAFTALAVAAPVLIGIGKALAFLGGAFALAKNGAAMLAAGTAGFARALAYLNRTALFAVGYLDRFSKGSGMFKAENGAVRNLITLIQKLGARIPFVISGFVGLGVVGAIFATGLAKIALFIATIAAAALGINEIIKLAFNFDPIAKFIEGLKSIATRLGIIRANPLQVAAGDPANKTKETLERLGIKPSDVQGGRGNINPPLAKPPVGRPIKPAGFRDQDALDNELKAIKELTAEFEKQRATTLKKLDLETSLIGKTEEQKQIAESQNQLAEEFLNIQNQLIKKRDSLSKEDLAQGKLLPAINEEIKKNANAYQGQLAALNKTVAANQHSLMLEKNRQQEIKNIVEAMEQQAEFAREIAELQNQQGQAKIQAFELLDAQKQQFDILMRREELERGILNLREQDKTAAIQLFELENERLKKLEEIQKIQNLPFEGVGGMKQRLAEVNAVFDARLARIQETQARTTKEQNSKQEIKNIVELMEQQAEAAREIAEFQNQQGQAVLSAFEQVRAQREQLELTGQREQLEKSIQNLRGGDQAAARELFDLETQRLTQLEAIRRIQNLPFEGQGGMKQQLQQINDLYDLRRAKITETAEATRLEQQSFTEGFKQAGERFRNNIKTDFEFAAEQLNTFTTGFENAFVRFVQTGKLSFKDLANSMIADFARIQAQKILTGFLSGAGGGGGGNFLSSLFGGFFADGGNPPMNKVSVVGERGPELFVPQSAGRVIPNKALGGSTSNTVNNTEVIYNIQAVDSQSFKALLARDPEFIHNVAEQGRRSLPIRSRR